MTFLILQTCTVSPTCRRRCGVSVTPRNSRPAARVPSRGPAGQIKRGPSHAFEGPWVSPLRPAEGSAFPGGSSHHEPTGEALSEPAETPAAVAR